MDNKNKQSHQWVNQTSGGVEFYTPVEIIEAARECLGGIELDPASCEVANQVVKAGRFFSLSDDGLKQVWSGNVWLNHPFGKHEKACGKNCKKKTCKTRGYHLAVDFPGNAAWITKLVSEYESGNLDQALNIVFCNTSEIWFRPLLQYPQCFIHGRTQFREPCGRVAGNATKGCVITYLGDNIDRFAQVFGQFGDIKVPYGRCANGGS